jgi:(p)ppGpp synthase/HD superfamily hydrolase
MKEQLTPIPEANSDQTTDRVGVARIVLLASSIAIKAHEGQFRRNGITPYIAHPKAVAESLEGESPEVIATAWLHDVLEDTDVTISEIKHAGIPVRVIEAVGTLTRWDGLSYEDYLHWITQDEIARKVKIADIRHNLSDSPTEKQVAKYEKALLILANAQAHTPAPPTAPKP